MKYMVKAEILIDSDDYPKGKVTSPEDARDIAYNLMVESSFYEKDLTVYDEQNNRLILIW